MFEGWKVAVPKASSLRGAAISQALVESHLLRQTAIRDEWKTANGRTVVVVKDPNTGSVRLTAGRGFPVQGNSVDVLAEDLWYGPTFDQGLQLVSVSDTLEKDSLSTLDMLELVVRFLLLPLLALQPWTLAWFLPDLALSGLRQLLAYYLQHLQTSATGAPTHARHQMKKCGLIELFDRRLT